MQYQNDRQSLYEPRVSLCCQFHRLLVWTCPHTHTWAAHTQRGGQRRKHRHGWGCLWANTRNLERKAMFIAQTYPPACCRVQADARKLRKMLIGRPAPSSSWTGPLTFPWNNLFACLDVSSLLPCRLMLNNYHGQNCQPRSKGPNPIIIAFICNKICLIWNYHWTFNCFLIICNMAGISAKRKGQHPVEARNLSSFSSELTFKFIQH